MTSTRLRADVYPANLVVAPPTAPRATSTRRPSPDDPSGARFMERVRVLVTADTVYVLQDSSQGPRVVFSERLQEYTPAPTRPSRVREASQIREATLTTDSGKTLAFHRGGGCGCGSRLKTFNTQDLLSAPLSLSSTKDHA